MSDLAPFDLTPGQLPLADLHALWRSPRPMALPAGAWTQVDAAADTVAAVVREDRQVYGVTTGFGSLARTSISAGQVTELQHRLVISHCVGLGEALSDRVVRMVLQLKINALAQGYSGIRRQVIEMLLGLLNGGATPVVPAKGSVGASGDLAPLAHLSAPIIGLGELSIAGERMPAAEGLQRLGMAPIELAAKEGLALLNGTQVSTALALDGLFSALDIFAAGLTAGAMSVDSVLGSDVPFDPRIQAVRGQPGQIRVAEVLRELLAGSEIRSSHLACDRVQDPYSLRCQPQVMGAALDVLEAAGAMLGREANAVSDNPLVFPDEGDILSGGNFHAEPVAMAADMIALAVAEIGALAERRIALLTDANLSSLPAFLTAEPGLNSGFMIAHVTAAALASENKSLAHPACVDSLPTSANQEDHVSMAAHGARRLAEMAANTGRIVAIELLAAAQGIDLRQPLKTSAALAAALAGIRQLSARLDQDRSLASDMEAVHGLIQEGWFLDRIWPRTSDRPVL